MKVHIFEKKTSIISDRARQLNFVRQHTRLEFSIYLNFLLHAHEKNIQFEDAFDNLEDGNGHGSLSRSLSNQTQMDLQQAIQESQLAIDYFFNNRFDEARTLMKPELSIYHAVGHSVFLFLEAMLTFVRIQTRPILPWRWIWLIDFNLSTYSQFRNIEASKLHRTLSSSASISAISIVANQRSPRALERRSKRQTTRVTLISRRTLSFARPKLCCSRRCWPSSKMKHFPLWSRVEWKFEVASIAISEILQIAHNIDSLIN